MQDVTVVYLGAAPVAEPEPEVIPGDVNGDGKLSIKDVTSLIELLLQNDEEDGSKSKLEEYPGADVNGDGKLTIRDVTLLIELLLNSGSEEEQ